MQLIGAAGNLVAYCALYLVSWAALREVPRLMAPDPPRESELAVLDSRDGRLIAGALFRLNPTTTLGSDPERADVVVSEGEVAPLHAELVWRNGGWHLQRLSPRGRLAVNGSEVRDNRPLRPGDVVEVGRSSFRLRVRG